MLVDATHSSSTAKMVNDGVGRSMNCVMKQKKIDGKVCLCLFSFRDIEVDEELRYDYGQKDLPWRKQTASSPSEPSDTGLGEGDDQTTDSLPQTASSPPEPSDKTLREDDQTTDSLTTASLPSEPSDKTFGEDDQTTDSLPEQLQSSTSLNIDNDEADVFDLGDGSSNSSDDSDPALKGAPQHGSVTVGHFTKEKRNARYFCGKVLLKISRHLLKCHGDEVDVARLAAMNKKSQARSDGLDLLRNKGNFYYNKKVLAAGRGELIVSRRPPAQASATDYGPCPTCLGYFLKTDLWKHSHYHCVVQKDLGSARKGSKDIRVESELLEGVPQHDKKFIQEVTKHMRPDNISFITKRDKLILNLGQNLIRKCVGMDPVKRRNYVSQKMRESARLLIQLRQLKPGLTSWEEFLCPSQFNSAVAAVRAISGNGTEDLEDVDGFLHPSLALKLGHNIKKLATIKMVLSIKEGDSGRESEAKNFIKLLNADWANNAELKKTLKELKDGKGTIRQDYKRCQLLVLAKLTTFNKRRPGEVEQLRLDTFTQRKDFSKELEVIRKTLTPLEQKLSDDLDLLYIRGKRGRKVPLLIPPNCLAAMERLVELRHSAGIAAKNKYFFGRFGATMPLRASDSLRILSEEADLECPKLIRTTKLRKFMATLTQVLNMNDSHTEWLADHLGHSLGVHKDYYKLPSSTIEKSKVAKLLIAVDSSHAKQFVGKSLDEIDFDEIPLDGQGTEKEESDDDKEPQDEVEQDSEEELGTISDYLHAFNQN
ncbi:hypothetical protein HOLleu_03094 [Holothuria leucospilota]|uniref:Uncharacterized protein n=1 Tax=Holothuria leucospilota TaxID=206669 RepID=A0A9Q1CRI7_HOLLE|nr:hypothetical protein HOLleu_03094 [Holothuria leucospilota]